MNTESIKEWNYFREKRYTILTVHHPLVSFEITTANPKIFKIELEVKLEVKSEFKIEF